MSVYELVEEMLHYHETVMALNDLKSILCTGFDLEGDGKEICEAAF